MVLGLGEMGFGVWFWGVGVGQDGFTDLWVGFLVQLSCFLAWGSLVGRKSNDLFVVAEEFVWYEEV